MEPKQHKSDEIIDFIQKLGSRIDKITLDQCEPDTIIELYAFLMEKLGIIRKENLKLEFEAMTLFTYNNLHNRPIYIIKLFKYMKDFLTRILSVDKFTTDDLLIPTAKKTRRLLHAIIKFFKFKLSEKEFNDLAKETSVSSELELLQSKEALEKAYEDLDALKKVQSNEKHEIENVTLKITELDKEEKEIETNITVDNGEINKWNDNDKEHNDKLIVIDQMQNTYLNSIRALKSQIVSSPAKMQSVINETQNQIDKINKEINEKDALCQLFEKHSTYFDLLSLSIKEYNNTVMDLDKTKTSSEELNNKIKEKKNNIEMKNKMIQENESKIETIQSQIDNFQQYISENQLKNKNEKSMKETEINDLKIRLAELAETMSSLDEKLNMSNNNIKSYEDNLQELSMLKNDFEKHIEEEMDIIHASVKEYCQKFDKILDQFQN